MSEYIKINNIFLNPTDYDSEPVEIGNTKRTPSGDMYTQVTAKYMKFELSIEGVSPSMHSNLLYLISLNRAFNGQAENLTYVDYSGDEYIVSIPSNGYAFSMEEGVNESYSWELTLEEV